VWGAAVIEISGCPIRRRCPWIIGGRERPMAMGKTKFSREGGKV